MGIFPVVADLSMWTKGARVCWNPSGQDLKRTEPGRKPRLASSEGPGWMMHLKKALKERKAALGMQSHLLVHSKESTDGKCVRGMPGSPAGTLQKLVIVGEGGAEDGGVDENRGRVNFLRGCIISKGAFCPSLSYTGTTSSKGINHLQRDIPSSFFHPGWDASSQRTQHLQRGFLPFYFPSMRKFLF